jgi:hypothetical protein
MSLVGIESDLADPAMEKFRSEVQKLTDRGWQVVRLRPGSKLAFEKNWPRLQRQAEDFRRGENVGVTFGSGSGGLHDIDLDLPQARALVGHPCFGLNHLPEFGRESMPAGRRGHRLVVSANAPGTLKVFGFRSPIEKAVLARNGVKKLTVAELRGSSGSQTAVPPSIVTRMVGSDTIDDALVWTDAAGALVDVPVMEWHQIERRVGMLAFAALAAALYPLDSERCAAFERHLFGSLMQCGVGANTALQMVGAVCLVNGDSKPRGNLALEWANEDLASFLSFAEVSPLERTVRSWLGLVETAENSQQHTSSGAIDADDLERLLDTLDPSDFSGYFAWRDIMFATHHATGGSEAGREIFVNWCARNPNYAGEEWSEKVRSAWRRASPTRAKGVTIATLLAAVRDAGHSELVADVMHASVASDFDGEPLDPALGKAESAEDATLSLGHRAGALSYVRADEVEQQSIRWLWPNRFAIGKLNGLAGMPDQGKSQVTLNIAATVSRGAAWPDGGKAEVGEVAILSAEDDEADTVAPRLEAAGADMSKVYLVRMLVRTKDGQRMFNVADDLDQLSSLIKKHPAIRLIIIDPITAYLGSSKTIDSFRNTDIRGVLSPLGDWAAKHGVAVIFLTHFSKGGKGPAIMRVLDSIAFVALSRAFWLVVPEQDDELGGVTGRKLLLKGKKNIGKDVGGLAYHIDGLTLPSGIETSRIRWDGTVTVTADDVMRQSEKTRQASPKLAAAAAFLLKLLKDGPMASEEVKRRGKEGGHSEMTLKRAKDTLPIDAIQMGRAWYWELIANTEDEDA